MADNVIAFEKKKHEKFLILISVDSERKEVSHFGDENGCMINVRCLDGAIEIINKKFRHVIRGE